MSTDILTLTWPAAHLFGSSGGWHAADLLLYGFSGLGLLAGMGLFWRGRTERRQADAGHADAGRDPGTTRPT